MKTITINVPDDCEIKIVKKEEEKESRFKKGDVITSKGGCIAIFEKYGPVTSNKKDLVYYSTICYSGTGKLGFGVLYGIGNHNNCRLATEEEKNILINALKKEASKSLEAIKVLKEIFNINYKPEIKTYQDLIDNEINLEGYYITGACKIKPFYEHLARKDFSEVVATTEKIAKSMLAMAMISQLMPFYGGEISEEEWEDDNVVKFIIERNPTNRKQIMHRKCWYTYCFLAFHTEEQRDEFIKYNEQLVKDYLMID